MYVTLYLDSIIYVMFINLPDNSATYDQPPPRAFSVQSSYKLNLPPHLIIPSSSIKLVESIGQGMHIMPCKYVLDIMLHCYVSTTTQIFNLHNIH